MVQAEEVKHPLGLFHNVYRGFCTRGTFSLSLELLSIVPKFCCVNQFKEISQYLPKNAETTKKKLIYLTSLALFLLYSNCKKYVNVILKSPVR